MVWRAMIWRARLLRRFPASFRTGKIAICSLAWNLGIGLPFARIRFVSDLSLPFDIQDRFLAF